MDGYITTADNVRLYFQRLGSGPNALVIPNAIYLCDDFQCLAGDKRTVIFYDLRNRGRSDTVEDPSKLHRGIEHDIDDLDEVRRHFGFEKISVLGHSYVGLLVVLYALKHPANVERIVQIGAPPPSRTTYPPELSCNDEVAQSTAARLAELQKERGSTNLVADPVAFCEKFWTVLRPLFVADPAKVEKIAKWGYCDCENERNFMKHFMTYVAPSLQKLNLTPEDFAKVQAPVLTIHGRKDRSAPYGGGLEWSQVLPNARLLTIDDAAHVPWIESPEQVFGAIEQFFSIG